MMQPTIHDDTPLFDLNPSLMENDTLALAGALNRYKQPWKETRTLNSPEFHISETFEVEEDDPLVALLLDNPVKEVTAADLFNDGRPDVVMLRVFTVANGDALKREIDSRKTLIEDTLFVKELTLFNEKEPHLFVGGAHFYVDANYPCKNLTLWDGERLRHIRHKEHAFHVPEMEFQINDVSYYSEGYDYLARVEAAVNLITFLNANRYKDQVNIDWVVGQPFYMLESAYCFLDEAFNDSLEMLLNSLRVN